MGSSAGRLSGLEEILDLTVTSGPIDFSLLFLSLRFLEAFKFPDFLDKLLLTGDSEFTYPLIEISLL
jgi:hypothetical protein